MGQRISINEIEEKYNINLNSILKIQKIYRKHLHNKYKKLKDDYILLSSSNEDSDSDSKSEMFRTSSDEEELEELEELKENETLKSQNKLLANCVSTPLFIEQDAQKLQNENYIISNNKNIETVEASKPISPPAVPLRIIIPPPIRKHNFLKKSYVKNPLAISFRQSIANPDDTPYSSDFESDSSENTQYSTDFELDSDNIEGPPSKLDNFIKPLLNKKKINNLRKKLYAKFLLNAHRPPTKKELDKMENLIKKRLLKKNKF